ncbi:GNAT family N-acetyltransferase [Craurococcus roseus]|uniref:GNAT family N-acetyltransferase n=1 Tax=Craurococcus roseus TaxID=77585 RepID=A0ABN1ENM2_9PROT
MGAAFIRSIGAEEARAAVPDLTALLIEAAAGGVEVSFLAPVPRDKAMRFWNEVAEAVGAGTRVLLVAEDGGGIAGTVQVEPVRSETAPRLASVAKLIVAERARRAGLGAALLAAAERAALAAGRDILVLDTEEHSAAHRLYLRAGWTLLGAIPDATLRGDGTPCANAVFWKRLRP